MGENPTANRADAKSAFADHLRTAKLALPEDTARGRGGPNKLLGEQMQISPARVSDFLDADFKLEISKKRKVERTHLQKAVRGFSTSVERALHWLQTKQGAGKNLDTFSVVAGYWERESRIPFESEVVQKAVRQGIENARGKLEKEKTIEVNLRITTWGPFGKHPGGPKESFFAHYGRAVFRGIDALNTITKVSASPFARKFDLPVRSSGGNWAVSMGPYRTLDRRFRRLEFVVFPALRYPLLGLVLSQEQIPDEVRFNFLSIEDATKSLLDRAFEYRRFVADEIAQMVIFSMFNETEEAKQKGRVTTLDSLDAQTISNRLKDEISHNPQPIAFLADGALAFEVFGHLVASGISVQVVGESLPSINFAFAGGIMFREEDHQLFQLLQDSQRLLFRNWPRIVGLLEVFLHEVDAWANGLRLSNPIIDQWPKDKPIFIYSHYEVTDYVAECFPRSDPASTHSHETAGKIFRGADNLLSEDTGAFNNSRILRKLFGTSLVT